MNTKAIEKEIFFTPFGFNCFGERSKNFEPLVVDDSCNQGLFEMRIDVSLMPYKYYITMNILRSDKRVALCGENFKEEGIKEFVNDIINKLEECVTLYGESHDFSLDKWEVWKDYFTTYITGIVRTECSLAQHVIGYMRESDLFPPMPPKNNQIV